MIYLDNNATTPLTPPVAGAMSECLKHNYGNPSSTHTIGNKARLAVEKARRQAAGLINAKQSEVTFTSGGTEANNMAILGTALRFGSGHIISSCIEHPSVANPLNHLEGLGFGVTCIPVDRHGRINADDIKKNITRNTILITVMHSNNETGSIQPIQTIGGIARERNIIFHCDAAQSAGKVPVDVKRLNVDLLTVVSHKFYGPKGVGALYIKDGVELMPLLYGASHEQGFRPGTENVPSIAGFGMASEEAKRDMSKRVEKIKHLSQLLFNLLRKQVPGLRLNGHPAKRLPNTLNLSFPNVQGSALLDKLKNEIAASTGSACHEGMHAPSSVLKAMGLSNRDAFSSIRLSLGIFNTEKQIRSAAKAIAKAYNALISS
jgi:cysteine desulfurase